MVTTTHEALRASDERAANEATRKHSFSVTENPFTLGFLEGIAHERARSQNIIRECYGFIEALAKGRAMRLCDYVDAQALHKKLATYRSGESK